MPTVLRSSLRPFRQVPSSCPTAPPWEFWNQLLLIPPRVERELELVVPLAVKYEYSGLMSRPLIGVTSGARMIAQSSPFSWSRFTPPFVDVALPKVVLALHAEEPQLNCRPLMASSVCTK